MSIEDHPVNTRHKVPEIAVPAFEGLSVDWTGTWSCLSVFFCSDEPCLYALAVETVFAGYCVR